MTQATQKHESESPSRVNAQNVCKLYFCPLEAEAIGLNEAIVVARLRFWLGRSQPREQDGKAFVDVVDVPPAG